VKALLVEALAEGFAGTRLAEVPEPSPGPGEVKLRVRAVSVNFPDLLMTRGAYQLKPTLPFTPGMDVAGEVTEVGAGVTRFRRGDAVVGGVRLGGMAQFAVASDEALSPKPDSLSFPEAAAYPAAYLTAYVALVRRGAARPGEWLLVHGAAGGVGLAALDLGRHLGLRTIAASASAAKLRILEREYAPDAVVDVSTGFREAVKAITGGDGADIIYDPVGGDVFDESVRCIAFDGRLLVVGFTSGRIPTISANMPLIKGFSVIGVRAGEYGRRHPQRGREDRAAVAALAASGAIRPRVHAALPLEAWREAFDLLADRTVVGKAVLLP
jgi:NADPH2:quinone reductase